MATKPVKHPTGAKLMTLIARSSRRAQHQTGQVIERSGALYVRYYSSEGGERKRVTERLCAKDHVHHGVSAAAVKRLRDQFMLRVNAEAGAAAQENPRDVVIAEFWQETYLPWLRENCKVSTVFGYEKIWHQHLAPHFGKRALRQYRTHEGSAFLTSLAKTLGRNSLSHVRSLASGIFAHALNLGLIDRNPWREVKVLAKVRAPEPTYAYSLEEVENIISALVKRVDAQCVVGLAFFLGLRPSEIAGLKWEDVDAEWLHIRRAAVRGVVGDTKTDESVASLPLIQPVRGMMQLWRAKMGSPSTGWCFPSKGGPLNVESLCRNVIIPACQEDGVKWRGLYAARRGAGTILTELTRDALAAQQVLRHRSLLTTTNHYVKPSAAAGLAGMRLLEEKAAAASTKERPGHS